MQLNDLLFHKLLLANAIPERRRRRAVGENLDWLFPATRARKPLAAQVRATDQRQTAHLPKHLFAECTVLQSQGRSGLAVIDVLKTFLPMALSVLEFLAIGKSSSTSKNSRAAKLRFKIMTKNVLTVMGALLVLVGILGFGVPGLFGMRLTPAHNLIHLVSGCLALYFGLKGPLSAARIFSLVFGTVYGLLGLIGLIAGGTHGLWAVIPNELVFGPIDHIVHLVMGGVFVCAGLDKSTKISPHRRNS